MRVYTAVFSRFDHIRSPKVISPAWTYTAICNPAMGVPAPWELSIREFQGSARKSARYYKINSHLTFPKSDITVWHGGNVQLLTRPDELVKCLGDKDIAVLRHSGRSSVYSEGRTCINDGKDSRSVIESQMARYEEDGFDGTPLSAAFLLVRRNTKQVAALNEMWWEEVDNGSVRDQLSFDYCCWKLGIEPAIIPGDIFSGPHFKRYPVHTGVRN